MQRQILDRILDKRLTQKGQVEYQVLFTGQSTPQWEPIINLKQDLDKLADFEVAYEIQKKKQQQQQKNDGKETEDEEEYEVEEIIEKRKGIDGIEYKVKWKGYPLSECTWEPAQNLQNAVAAMDRFKQKEREKLYQNQEENPKTKQIKKTQQENEKGHFNTDTPEKVIAAHPEQNQLLLTIRWQPRSNGQVPQDSVFSNKEIFQFNPRFLADYYESKLKFIPIPQSSNNKSKSILIDEAND